MYVFLVRKPPLSKDENLSFRIADRIGREFAYATVRLVNNRSPMTLFVMRMGLHWCIYVRDPLKRRSRGGW